MRVLSLLPSSTEIVCALGCKDLLVGRSHECDFPPDICALPAVTSPKFVLDGRSYEIEQKIKAILAEGVALYRVHAEELRELAPDVIITQVQCEVCAVSLADVELALEEYLGKRPKLVALNPNSLSDIWSDIERVADALECPERGKALVRQMKEEMARIAAESLRSSQGLPRVIALEWLEPLMTGGNWMPELLSIAGAVSLLAESGKHSPWIDFQTLVDSDPDFLLLLPCGFDMERTREELPTFWQTADWRKVRAVREGNIFLLDGNQYFNRPGPRIVDSLRILCEVFQQGGEIGEGWERVKFPTLESVSD